jgi:hypothetical protein
MAIAAAECDCFSVKVAAISHKAEPSRVKYNVRMTLLILLYFYFLPTTQKHLLLSPDTSNCAQTVKIKNASLVIFPNHKN